MTVQHQLYSHLIDEINTKERVARLFSRSIKKDSKLFALNLTLSMIDLTTLEGKDSHGKVKQLCYKATHLHDQYPDLPTVAAICVYPTMVPIAKKALTGTNINIASVATSFPSGMADLQSKLDEVKSVIDAGANEIDMVISRGRFLRGDYNYVSDEIAQVKDVCGDAHLKVILETGELVTLDNVRLASDIAMEAGADFIKTSTGKESINANLNNSLVMLRMIRQFYQMTGKKIGFKPAGGISTAKTVIEFLILVMEELGHDWINPKYLRIGASSLLIDIERQLYHFALGRYANKEKLAIG